VDHLKNAAPVELDRAAMRYAAILQIMCAGNSEDFTAEMWEEILGTLSRLQSWGSAVANAACQWYQRID
jgi:hypothetical protein